MGSLTGRSARSGLTLARPRRVAHLTPELEAALVVQVERVNDLERTAGRIVRWLLPHVEGQHAGERIIDPRKAWAEACKKTGQPGILLHVRRSAVQQSLYNSKEVSRMLQRTLRPLPVVTFYVTLISRAADPFGTRLATLRSYVDQIGDFEAIFQSQSFRDGE